MSEKVSSIIKEAKPAGENKEKKYRLDLGNCGLSKLPADLFELVWLEELILGSSWFLWNTLEKEWELNRSRNEGLPNAFSRLFNGFKPLPELKRLVLSGVWHEREPEIDALFATVLPALQHLDLSDNPRLSHIRFLKHVKKLERLDIGNTGIKDLTPIEGLENLQYLHLNSSLVTDLMPLGELKNLRVLHIEGLQTQDINVLEKLENLEVLSINGLMVRHLKPLEKLTKLTHFYANKTNISSLEPLKNLNALEDLYLGSPEVEDLEPLGNLHKLEHLFLGATRVRDISPLGRLGNLKYLDISNTPVGDLSPLVALIQRNIEVKSEWEYGNGIFVKGCTELKTPPIEIIRHGHKAVLRYFDQLGGDQESSHLYEAKLLIVGEGGAGKTSLRRKLLDPTSELPKEKESTRGIDIEAHYFFLSDGAQFRINIWDFAGQGKYQAAHNFFYTQRSLYILVDDTRTKDSNEEYFAYYNHWLQTAEIFGGGSPLLVVHNQKADRVRAGFNLGDFQSKYNFVKELYRINLGADDTAPILSFRSAIHHYIQQLPHVGQILPKNWILARESVEKLRFNRPYITQSEFYKICKECEIFEEEKQQDLSGYFHDLGIFLHYRDSPALKHFIFLQNEWTTSAVYKILDDAEVESNMGIFTTNDLKRIWNGGGFAQMRDELLELMKKFELCYPLEHTNKYVVPQLLPGFPPPYVLGEGKCLQLKYRYAFIPKGLLHRFIVRMHQNIASNQTLVWNNGIVLELDGNRAEVKETPEREIDIRVIGRDPQMLINTIAYEIERLNAGFGSHLRVDKMVPCICSYCEKHPIDCHFYRYELLRLRKEKGRLKIDCEKGDLEEVLIDTLLDNVATQVSNAAVSSREKIRLLVAFNKTEEALDLLEDLSPSEAILLQSKLNQAKNAYNLGLLTTDEYARERQEANRAALDFAEM